jgi:hypothetical protein
MSTTGSAVALRQFLLDTEKLRLAQTLIHAATEAETIDRALDLMIAEEQRNQLAMEANWEFLTSGAVIEDVYEKLDK